jgi:hypothetical protein
LIVLQNVTYPENVQGLCTEIWPAYSHDAFQASTIKAEELSDIEAEEGEEEEEEYPLTIAYPGIKPEPEVSHLCSF